MTHIRGPRRKRDRLRLDVIAECRNRFKAYFKTDWSEETKTATGEVVPGQATFFRSSKFGAPLAFEEAWNSVLGAVQVALAAADNLEDAKAYRLERSLLKKFAGLAPYPFCDARELLLLDFGKSEFRPDGLSDSMLAVVSILLGIWPESQERDTDAEVIQKAAAVFHSRRARMERKKVK